MENTSQFSVSICVYGKDNPEYFDIAVESILNQTIPPTEVVLVVDGPVPDKLNEIINKYEANKLFNTIRLNKNQGHGNARRIGLQNCTNNLVALMDADDISYAYRFEKQLEIFKKNPNISVVGSMITEFIDDPNNIITKRIVPSEDIEIKKFMKKRCPINQMSVMFKKSVIEKAGNYIDWYNEEDYYLWIRLALIGAEFYNINDVLVNVRIGPEMYQRRGGVKYFFSEYKLQKYLYENNIIKLGLFLVNVIQRFIVQIVLPNKIRGFVFQVFAREKIVKTN